MFVASRRVSAQEPTATYRPLIVSSTPLPPITPYPPQGNTPIGWGTITPNWVWLAQCQDNILAEIATETYLSGYASRTPTPGTYTPTLTPTVTNTFVTPNTLVLKPYMINNAGADASFSGLLQCVNQVGTRFDAAWGQTSMSVTGNTVECVGSIDVVQTSAGANDHYIFGVEGYNSSGGITVYYNWDTQYSCTDSRSQAVPAPGYGTQGWNTTPHDFFGKCVLGTNVYSGNIYVYFKVSRYPLVSTATPLPTYAYPTATPVSTPSGDEYCNEVHGDDWTPGGGSAFSYTLPFAGTSQCITWETVPLGTYWGVELEFPAGSMCFTPVYLGNVVIAGVSVSLDLAIGVLVSAMIIRWLLRS